MPLSASLIQRLASALASPYIFIFSWRGLSIPPHPHQNQKRKRKGIFHYQIRRHFSIMNMLDSSSLLDALPLNYVGFGVFTVVVNNLWTWVAVVTAAVSFWRIRTTSFSDNKPDDHHQQPHIDRNTSGGSEVKNPSAKADSLSPPASTTTTPIPALPSAFGVKDVDGVTEGTKFTLYYQVEEEERESDGGDGDGQETVVKEWRDDDDDGVSCGEWWERVTIRARIEHMGWYRYQDMTVVNGNVVRLWDDRRRRSEKGFCYSSLVIG